MSDKIKIQLNGTAETMLQSFYARCQYSNVKKITQKILVFEKYSYGMINEWSK